jgi:hypothetical protein
MNILNYYNFNVKILFDDNVTNFNDDILHKIFINNFNDKQKKE